MKRASAREAVVKVREAAGEDLPVEEIIRRALRKAT